MKRLIVLGIAAGLVGSACAGDVARRDGSPTQPTMTSWDIPPASPTEPTEEPTTMDPPIITGPEPTSPPPAFHGSASVIGDATRARMTHSWRPGCPVPIEDLRLLTITHWGFDGAVHSGEMVVNQEVAGSVLRAFESLFEARFPIQRMVRVDEYGADDDASMAANNTSAFNCRPVTGNPGVWSEHSYGWAIDINPIQNPYVSGDTVLPPAGAPYVDRSSDAMGLIHPDDVVVRAFEAIGWEWGGSWSSIKDYQHFSETGG